MKTNEARTSKVNMAFQSHIAQYEALRGEITQATNAQNDMVNYSVALIAGLVGLFLLGKNDPNFTFLNENPFTLLIASSLMSLMTWVSLENEIRIHDYRNYIHKTLSAKVQELIGKTDISSQYSVLKMEIAEISRQQIGRTLLRGLLVSGKFLISYIPAISLLLFFLLGNPKWTPNWYIVLFCIAALAALVVPLAIISQAIYVSGYYWKKRKV
jgi:hypothetical protein